MMFAEAIARARRLLLPSDDNLLARSLTLNVLGRGAGLMLGFVGSVLLARLLGPADRGLVALMWSISTVALGVTALGQPLAVTYYASRKDADNRAILGNTIVQAAILAAVLVPLTLLLHRAIADAFGRGQGGLTWVLAAGLVPITFLDWTSSNQLLGMLRFGLYNGVKLIAMIAYTGAIYLFLKPLGLGVAGGLIATALGSLVTIALSVPPILGARRLIFDRQLMRRMVHYGSRVQVGVIFQMVNYRLDVVVMQFFRPLRDVGYYVVAQTIAELVITLATAFQSSLLPLSSHFEGDARQEDITRSSLHHHGILATIAVMANAVVGSLIIVFAYGRAYHSAVVPMLVLLPGIWFLGLGLVIQSDLGGRGRPGTSSALAGVAAGGTVVLDLLLIPPLGVMGGALASVAAYTAFGITSLIALSRVSGIPPLELLVPTRSEFAVYRRVLSLVWLRGLLGGPADVTGPEAMIPVDRARDRSG